MDTSGRGRGAGAVLGRPLEPEGDRDGLIAVSCQRDVVVADLCAMLYTERGDGFDQPGAGSHTGTSKEPCRTRTTRVSHLCPKSREAVQNLPKSTECIMLARL